MSELDVFALPLDLVAAGETDRGLVRATNEDAVLVRADLGLYVVADGAGGHSAGNVASAIATSTVGKHFDSTKGEYETKPEVDAFGLWTGARRLASAIHRANAAVIEIARSSNKYLGMGTTIVSALVVPESGRIHLAHVGDSRCYRLRGRVLELLTHDHSILNDVVELHPDLDDEALARLPRKAVTRALGMEPTVRASVRTLRAVAGDRYLLCSDGLTSELGSSVLREMLAQDAQPAEIVADLVRAAKEAGGRDNITALVVECRPADEARRLVHRAKVAASRRNPLAEPLGPLTLDELKEGDPEIVLIRRKEDPDEPEPRISVVPATKTDENMIRALDRIAGTFPSLTTVTCKECNTRFDRDLVFCPKCGYAVTGRSPP